MRTDDGEVIGNAAFFQGIQNIHQNRRSATNKQGQVHTLMTNKHLRECGDSLLRLCFSGIEFFVDSLVFDRSPLNRKYSVRLPFVDGNTEINW